MKISVILSVYNCEKYIREAVNSILQQTFRDFELIIINDYSTDSTKNIIFSFNDPRIVYIENKTNIGLTKSLNKGLSMAKGEYVARMDADDVAFPQRLEEQLKYMESYKDVALAGSFAVLIDENGSAIRKIKLPADFAALKFELLFNNALIHSTIFFRKKAIIQSGGYNEDFKCAQDYELYTRLATRSIITNIPKYLLKLRIHKDSISKKDKTHLLQKEAAKKIKFQYIDRYYHIKRQEFEEVDEITNLEVLEIKKYNKFVLVYNKILFSYIKAEKINIYGCLKLMYKFLYKIFKLLYIKIKMNARDKFFHLNGKLQ